MTFPRQVFERYTQPLALDVQPPPHLGRLRTEDGMRFFGLLSLRSHHGGYEDTVAVRNSHDKKFPLGIGFGGRVFCCDKLSFIAGHIIRRKHTTNARRDLPALIGELVEPLAIQREQHHTFLRYQETLFPEAEANDAIMTMFRTGVINLARIAGVIGHWENPVISNGASGRLGDRSTPTSTLAGKVVENADLTQRQHRIIDGVCRRKETADAAWPPAPPCARRLYGRAPRQGPVVRADVSPKSYAVSTQHSRRSR